MGEMFRGKDMSYGQLLVPMTIAIETVEKVGQIGKIQFIDMNDNVSTFERRYANEIKRCEEIERIIRGFDETMTNEENRQYFDKLFYRKPYTIEDFNMERKSSDEIILEITQVDEELKTLVNDVTIAEKGVTNIKEEIEVCNQMEELLGDIQNDSAFQSLKCSIGICDHRKWDSIKMILWRISRGFIVIRSTPVSNGKVAFLLVIQGEELYQKTQQICSSSGVRIFENIPIERQEREEYIIEKNQEENQLTEIFNNTLEMKRQCLKRIGEKIECWKYIIERERKIYFVLNMFHVDEGHSHLCGEGWFPTESFQEINNSLDEMETNIKPVFGIINQPNKMMKPTFIPTSPFTQTSQDLCDSYAIPKYGEVNPGFTYTITFPFLFGIMFGDVGHGFILFMVALLMIIFQNKLKKINLNEIFLMLFDARWMLLLMGVFAIYSGVIYNETFGFAIDIFGTAWNTNDGNWYSRSKGNDYVYYVGVDPIWKSSGNELYFYNSFKMKLSILVGVIHMTCGIVISCVNHFHYKNLLDIVFRFIPEITFMICSFGYLAFLILYKWMVYIEDAPMITTVFLEMFQEMGNVSEGNKMFNGQEGFQKFLFALIIISLLMMFIPKPAIVYYLKLKDKKKKEIAEKNGIMGDTEMFYEHFDDANNDAFEHYSQTMDRNEQYQNPFIHDMNNSMSSEESFDYYNDQLLGSQTSDSLDDQMNEFREQNKSNHYKSKNCCKRCLSTWNRHCPNNRFELKEWVRVKDDPDDEEGNTLMEIIIFNSIHAVEFSLSCISNTASYLRLWALSLAHAQLCNVFLEYVFYLLLGMNNFICTFVGFAVFALITLGILIAMEALSAFLHTLRLHWVEFQNKFYLGDGVKFTPFTIN